MEMGETSVIAWIVVTAFVVLILVPASLVALALGPLWWLVIGLAVVATLVVGNSIRDADGDGDGDGDSDPDEPARTNCVNCGARTDADAATCSYCGEPLE